MESNKKTQKPSFKSVTDLLNESAAKRAATQKRSGVIWSEEETEMLMKIVSKILDSNDPVKWTFKDIGQHFESICPGKSKGAVKKKLRLLKKEISESKKK